MSGTTILFVGGIKPVISIGDRVLAQEICDRTVKTADGITIFAINRSLDETMPLDINLSGFDRLSLAEALVLRHDDLQAVNTETDPEKVAPTVLDDITVTGDRVAAVLPPASWNMIRLRSVSPS